MRGKKGAQATNRREREEWERRALAAEAAASRLTGELAGLKDRAETEIHALRTALSNARKERDAAASPQVAVLEEQNRLLREERDLARELAKGRDEQLMFGLNRMKIIAESVFGLTDPEARELAISCIARGVHGNNNRLVSGHGDIGDVQNPELAKILQRAKGLRSRTDVMDRVNEALGLGDGEEVVG